MMSFVLENCTDIILAHETFLKRVLTLFNILAMLRYFKTNTRWDPGLTLSQRRVLTGDHRRRSGTSGGTVLVPVVNTLPYRTSTSTDTRTRTRTTDVVVGIRVAKCISVVHITQQVTPAKQYRRDYRVVTILQT